MIDHSKFKKITTLIFDVDGVFTDCSVLVTEDGKLLRTMNVRDGQSIKLASEAGYRLCAITKGASVGVKERLIGLGIPTVYDGLKEKLPAFNEYISLHQISKEEILYVGDDIPDLAIFPYVGISCCPSDASNDVLKQADYISPKGGGHGCIRDIIEKVMRIQDTWPINH